MVYDLRMHIEKLKECGELVEINDEIDWKYDGYAFAILSQRVRGPTLLFNKIKDVEGRLLVGLWGGSFSNPLKRIALALGIDPKTPPEKVLLEIKRKLATPIRPIEVATGPCKEVVKKGKDVDLTKLPFIVNSPYEGGRVLLMNTIITKDPESEWVNWANYGVMIVAKNRVAVTPGTSTDFMAIYQKHLLKNEPMPVAIVFGGDPVVHLLSGLTLPRGVTEADVAGGIRGEPIELVRAETSDLLVPAYSEIVLEGEIIPGEQTLEGPKTEFFGYIAGPRGLAYSVRIHSVTYRKNPINYTLSHTAESLGELECFGSLVCWNLGLTSLAHAFGVPVKAITFTGVTQGPPPHTAIIAGEKYPGIRGQLFDLISPFSGMWGDLYAFYDEDVSLFRPEMMIDARFTKCDPKRDMYFYEKKGGGSLLYRVYWEKEDMERECRALHTNCVFMTQDARTKGNPPLGVKTARFETLIPEHIQKWVVENWSKFGFKEPAYWNKKWEEIKEL